MAAAQVLAGDRHQRPGHHPGRIRQQEGDHPRDLLGLHPALEVRLGISARFCGVSMMLGSTALTVMSCSFSSSASAS
jgi:hypothetical protein